MELKKFIKYFILFFLISFLFLNWSKMCWIFNYKIIFGLISDFFSEKNSLKIEENIEEKNQKNSEIERIAEAKKESEYLEEEMKIEIPKIGISVPLIFVEKESEISNALNKGAVHFPSSSLPGEKGQIIILGHSAPPGWPKIKYDWIFSNLNQLKEGDEIFIYFKNKKFIYKVTKKIFLARGEEISQKDLTENVNMLILISCWPPGKDFKRIAVLAK